jgi:hypothetical protein
MSTEKIPKKAEIFYCETCDFKCCKKSNYNAHLLTAKHKKSTESTIVNEKNTTSFTCEYCSQSYKERTGLWRHIKKCRKMPKNAENIEPFNMPVMDMSYNIILEIVKQNKEFKEILMEQSKENQKLQQQLIEMAKEGKIINNNTNCNNNNFNLQLFLNEKCKDALNIDDFVGQIKLQLSDLDMIGRVGYMEGMSKIFLRNLKALDVSKRPIHCSDLKREVLYVKDKDAWEKENSENFKIKRAIKEIECKNIKQIPKWREENPTADDTETKKHMEYQNILLEAMGGATSEDDNKKHEKIIRNIAKEVVIDKSTV